MTEQTQTMVWAEDEWVSAHARTFARYLGLEDRWGRVRVEVWRARRDTQNLSTPTSLADRCTLFNMRIKTRIANGEKNMLD